MSKSKKKGTGEVRTLAAWLQQVVLQPEQVERSVIAELVKLASRLGVDRINLTFDLRDEDWLSRHRKQVEIYLAWLVVLEQLLQGIPLEKIAVPESLLVPEVSEPKAPPGGPWLDFGLTATQWQMSIHDVLMRSAVVGSVAASNALSRAGIKTVGDFYGSWNGDDGKISSGFIRNFGLKRLQIVKQALKEAKIPWPVWSKASDTMPWEAYGLMTKEQWHMSIEGFRHSAQGANEQRVLNLLRRGGIRTVGQLYELWRGDDVNLLDVHSIGFDHVTTLRAILTRAGIPIPLSG